MFWNTNNIKDDHLVTEIVNHDYRTSRIFRKYGVDFCCGGKRPLHAVCDTHGLDIQAMKEELSEAMRVIQIPSSINFYNWGIEFIIDYIINVHHSYLIDTLPDVTDTVRRFTAGHQTKYPYLTDLLHLVCQLQDELIPHIEQENCMIFPYIKQIVHAYEHREPYASLLVRTLRKPIENLVMHEDQYIGRYIQRIRQLTDNYIAPANSCITHKVAFSKLKELDQDLEQHIHLENDILFPRAIALEKKLLENILC